MLDAQRRENIAPKFLTEFHDLGAQVGQSLLPGRGLVVLHRGAEQNPVVFAMSTSYILIALTGILAFSFVVFRLFSRRAFARSAVWDGGLRRLWPTMTYTATGFSNPIRVIFFDTILSPRAGEDSVEAVTRHFRTAIVRNRATIHIVDRWILSPAVVGLRSLAGVLRKMHVGHVNAYAGYVLLTMLLVLVLGAGIFHH
jgi:hydrogenase-4 component B